jgi:WD40 repeat protein
MTSKLTALCLVALWLFASGKPSVLAGGEPGGKLDQYGDPLPAQARFRFGSIHFRHPGGIDNSALSPDGRFLATAGQSLRIWNVATGHCVRRFPRESIEGFACPGLAYSPDGSLLAYMQPGYGCVIDLKTGKEIWRSSTHRGYGFCQFAPNSMEIVLEIDEKFVLWSLSKETVTHTMPYVSLLTPDLTTFAAVEEGQEVIIGDVRTGAGKAKWKLAAGQNGAEMGLAFSPDSRELAIVARDKEIQVRDLGSCKVRIAWPLPNAAFRPPQTACGEYRLSFARDGKTLILGAGRAPPGKGQVFLWDAATGKQRAAFAAHDGHVTGLHTLADGRTLLTTGADGLIRRWSMDAGKEIEPPGRLSTGAMTR